MRILLSKITFCALFVCGTSFALLAQATLQQKDIQTHSFTLVLHTNHAPQKAGVVCRSQSGMLAWHAIEKPENTAEINLTGLEPGTVYWIKTAEINGKDTLFSAERAFCTQSLSTGEIKIFFNHSIDNQFVGNKLPSGTDDDACLAEIISRIDNATTTLDVAIYNNNRDDITTALKNAHNRGVRVRYIASSATQNYALDPAPAFPVVYGNTDYLMHNKFVVADAGNAAKAWVMSGSMNWTTSNISNDFNNMLWIQDQSLAQAYTLEFEEMWGSTGAQPNPANQRFGNDKTDNTPHQFIIGGIPVESYFSPSDHVTDQIIDNLSTAHNSVEFGLLTFTMNDIGDQVADKFSNENVAIRGLIENINDTGSEFAYLKSLGIDVLEHTETYQMHHKYAVIDALNANSNPTVWTGSHNWTYTAETQNDENSLAIHNADIARLYRAEFEARYDENQVATHEAVPVGFRVQPNPAYDTFQVISDQFDLDTETRIQIWSATGTRLMDNTWSPGIHYSLKAYPDGAYIIKIIGKNGFAALPLQKISR